MAVRNGLPDEALRELYPFEDKYVELPGGRQMHYIETGRAGLRRPTFLLLHGNPTWSFMWRHFMDPLGKIGRVIAVDHIGLGRSDHPRDPGYHRLERHIVNLEAFCEALDLKRVIPVMQDWGGPIGLGWATRHPERLEALVVMNTWAFAKEGPKLPLWFKAMRSRGIGEWVLGRRNLFIEEGLPKDLVRPTTEAVMDGYRHPFPTNESRTALVQFPRMLPDRESHPDWQTMLDIEARLDRLDVPAAIFWGAKDGSQEDAHRFHELLPQAEKPRWFEEAGHYLAEDAPTEVVLAIKDFAKRI